MLSYCEYLALRSANPHQDFYLETIIYEIPECNDCICQWNGYELDRIFGIDSPKNIKTLFSEEEWSQIISEIRQTEFWKHNWNYPVAITTVLNKHGLNLKNERGDFSIGDFVVLRDENYQKSITDRFKETWLWYTLTRLIKKALEKKFAYRINAKDKLFCKYEGDIFTGQMLRLNYRGNERERIENEIRKTFVFPPIEDKKNKDMAEYLNSVNAVAIHARRGDMAGSIAWCYKYGYFKRAVKHIKRHVSNPVFVFFTNPGSIEWCKENASVFGLNLNKDCVKFVDWNRESESYRDMQLMGLCKHAIVTPSSFGWWGAWFIQNPDKITISPRIELDTTCHY